MLIYSLSWAWPDLVVGKMCNCTEVSINPNKMNKCLID